MAEYSVLMSVYIKEDPEFLKCSIDSILAQTLLTNDFVIVCDGPLTSELDSVLLDAQNRSDAIIVHRLEKNAGLGSSLNEGMKLCKNDIIARMDSDDFSAPNRCELQVGLLCEKGLDIVSATAMEFSENINNAGPARVLPETNEDIYIYARRRNPFNHPCVVFRKKAVLEAGGYLGDFPFFEDYYLWVRMLQNDVQAYNFKEPLIYMRSGSGMYERRGGYSYFKKMLKFRKWMRMTNFSQKSDYIICYIGQGLICLLPTFLRRMFYEKMLRK